MSHIARGMNSRDTYCSYSVYIRRFAGTESECSAFKVMLRQRLAHHPTQTGWRTLVLRSGWGSGARQPENAGRFQPKVVSTVSKFNMNERVRKVISFLILIVSKISLSLKVVGSADP